jgi:hypothetical protein
VALLQHTIAEHSPSPATFGHRTAPHLNLSSLPLSAQGLVSATLGADDPAYRIAASGGDLQAQSPAQRLRMRFGSTGVQIGSGKTHIGLSLRAVGYGTVLRPVESVRPSASANRVTYRHAGLSEWYRNGPLGLEQGFTIARAPSGHPAGALTFSMAFSGNAHTLLAPSSQSIVFSHRGDPSLRYDGLTATDASGRALHSWLALYRGRIMLRVDTRGARYPLRIDPLIGPGEMLTGEGEPAARSFGWSVALSADGNTALVASPNGEQGGNAWVFMRSGSTWTQQGTPLHAPGGGFSVALSADGDTALIGESAGNTARVYTRTDSMWTQQEVLSGGVGCGQSVALSATGDTALVGCPGAFGDDGTALVIQRSGATWTQEATLYGIYGGGETGEGQFGHAVALAADGNTAIVGAPFDNSRVGAAWVFTRSGSTWTQQGPKLTGGEEIGQGDFGESIALSADGDTTLIGSESYNDFGGAAWVFARSGSTWTQQGEKLTGSGEVGEAQFGFGVALSADGDTALIGGPGDDVDTGAIWTFGRSGSTWTQQGPKLTGEAEAYNQFGYSVALSSEGGAALIGGPYADKNLGAAWVFTYIPPGPAPTVKKVSPSKGPAAGGTTVRITGTGFTGTTAVDFGSTSATSFTVNSATSITATSPEGTTGTVDITVTTPNGTSAISTKDHFKFEAPTVTSVNPDTGSTAGGTTVTIAGTGFALGTSATTVKFGSTLGASVDCTSTTACTAVAPAHKKAGVVEVRITVSGATSPKDPPADRFTYH